MPLDDGETFKIIGQDSRSDFKGTEMPLWPAHFARQMPDSFVNPEK